MRRDEDALGIPHKKPTAEQEKKRMDSVKSRMTVYYAGAEQTISGLQNEELEKMRLNLYHAIILQDIFLQSRKDEEEFEKEIWDLNKKFLHRLRMQVILEQDRRGIQWQKSE